MTRTKPSNNRARKTSTSPKDKKKIHDKIENKGNNEQEEEDNDDKGFKG